MYAIFASSFPITKILLCYAEPFFLTGIRMITAGLLLLGYYTLYLKRRCSVPRNHYLVYAQIVVIGFYFNYLARYWSINYLSSAKAGVLFTLHPVISALFSYIFFGEKTSGRQWLGFVFGILAIAPIMIPGHGSEQLRGTVSFFALPELIILLSIITDCYKWILIRRLVLDHTCSPFMVNGICMTAGGMLALITSLALEKAPPVSSMVPFAGYMAMYILISNIISANFYSFLLRSYTATFLSLAGFMAPLFSATYGFFFLKEPISCHMYLSALILAIGLYTFLQDEPTNGHEH
jgi:drug/metabolite transporter (DMT)-like permease